MNTSRLIKDRVNNINRKIDPLTEEVIVHSQMQNLIKKRLVEASLLLLPWVASHRFIFPRFGFVVRKGMQSIVIDSLLPSLYFFYFVNKDRHHLAKIIGVEESTRIDIESLEKRAKFINQFWTNSQYWH